MSYLTSTHRAADAEIDEDVVGRALIEAVRRRPAAPADFKERLVRAAQASFHLTAEDLAPVDSPDAAPEPTRPAAKVRRTMAPAMRRGLIGLGIAAAVVLGVRALDKAEGRREMTGGGEATPGPVAPSSPRSPAPVEVKERRHPVALPGDSRSEDPDSPRPHVATPRPSAQVAAPAQVAPRRADAPDEDVEMPLPPGASPAATAAAVPRPRQLLDDARQAISGGTPQLALDALRRCADACRASRALEDETTELKVHALRDNGEEAAASLLARAFIDDHPDSPRVPAIRALVVTIAPGIHDEQAVARYDEQWSQVTLRDLDGYETPALLVTAGPGLRLTALERSIWTHQLHGVAVEHVLAVGGDEQGQLIVTAVVRDLSERGGSTTLVLRYSSKGALVDVDAGGHGVSTTPL